MRTFCLHHKGYPVLGYAEGGPSSRLRDTISAMQRVVDQLRDLPWYRVEAILDTYHPILIAIDSRWA